MNKLNKEKMVENFTYNVAKLRKINNFSLKEMSERLDISIYSINQIEKGILPPKLKADIVFTIKKRFNIPPKDLFEKKL